MVHKRWGWGTISQPYWAPRGFLLPVLWPVVSFWVYYHPLHGEIYVLTFENLTNPWVERCLFSHICGSKHYIFVCLCLSMCGIQETVEGPLVGKLEERTQGEDYSRTWCYEGEGKIIGSLCGENDGRVWTGQVGGWIATMKDIWISHMVSYYFISLRV